VRIDNEGSMHTKVYTTEDGRAVIEQPTGTVVLKPEQIAAVIEQLHVCYDYCAAWKRPNGMNS
jgi:hypothetical protein